MFGIRLITTQHEMEGTYLYPSRTNLGLIVILLAQLPVAAQPGKGPLHHPTFRQQHETLGILGPTHGFHSVTGTLLTQPALQGPIVITTIAIGHLQPRVVDRVQLFEHLRGSRTVVRLGAGDGDRQQQPQAIYDDVTFATLDLLAGVVAAWTAHFRGLDRLAIDVSDAGRRLPPLALADLRTQSVQESLPGPILLPSIEVVADGALGEQVVREIIPLAAGAGFVEEGIEYLPHIDLAGSSAWFGRRDKGLKGLPLYVGHVRGIAFPHEITPGWRSADVTPLCSRILRRMTLSV